MKRVFLFFFFKLTIPALPHLWLDMLDSLGQWA